MTKRALGFTIVELVVVLLLLGILSATAMSRFLGPSTFTPAALSAAVTAQAHYAALSAQTNTNNITFSLSQVAGAWQFDVLEGAITHRSTRIDIDDTALTVVNNGNTYALNATTALALNFNDGGELTSGLVGATPLLVSNGTQLNIQGASLRVLCFYPTGYVSAQAC